MGHDEASHSTGDYCFVDILAFRPFCMSYTIPQNGGIRRESIQGTNRKKQTQGSVCYSAMHLRAGTHRLKLVGLEEFRETMSVEKNRAKAKFAKRCLLKEETEMVFNDEALGEAFGKLDQNGGRRGFIFRVCCFFFIILSPWASRKVCLSWRSKRNVREGSRMGN